MLEGLKAFRPEGGTLVLSTPAYPGFFEMVRESPFELREVELIEDLPVATLNFEAIEREFMAGANAFILCNPHNPHGVAFTVQELERLAQLAAEYNVFVMSDEIHAPLTHRDTVFTPFAPIAEKAGALSATATSASKGWNIAGTKCGLLIAAGDRANDMLRALPTELSMRASIVGWHASIAAFRDARDWLDRTVLQIEANQALLAALIEEHLPTVEYATGRAGYLAWLDLRETGLGEHPTERILADAMVALNDGRRFGRSAAGFGRLNFAAAPETIVRGIDRISALVGIKV